MTGVSADDLAAASRQRGRTMRGVVEVAHRCPCGEPDVVRTAPRLPDGTPFPTSYYATCPRLTGPLSTLETQGVMREMESRLSTDPVLAEGYRRAHEDYLARRGELGDVPEVAGVSAGGMPDRVKCLHVLVAHSLAAAPASTPSVTRRWPCSPLVDAHQLRRRGSDRRARTPWLTPWVTSSVSAPSTAAPTPSASWSPTSTGIPGR